MKRTLVYTHSEKFRDNHEMDAFGIFCFDGRFNDEFFGLRKALGKKGIDAQQTGGGSLAFFGSEYGLPAADGLTLFGADFAKRRHGVNRFFVVDHEDCGAYRDGLAFKFDKDRLEVTREEILQEQEHNLPRARRIILEKFPGCTVRIFQALINKHGFVEVYELHE